ncbi:MAG: ATP-binding cassette domain-containing protein [Rhodocyclaceae bacterium]|nr:ATP-binding cassette domain-containing protein [Rhodocyclaceae bacterium]
MKLIADAVVVGWRRPLTPPLSFTLERGKTVGIQGPNGVGKSTLLAAIAGEAQIFSGVLLRPPTWRIAWLAQHAARPEETPYSGEELLAAYACQRHAPPQRLAQVLPRRLDRISGGEFQLLMLWAVLTQGAELVLLDEPTNHLDHEHIGLAIEEVQNVQKERAILIVSHDHDFLATVAHEVIALSP